MLFSKIAPYSFLSGNLLLVKIITRLLYTPTYAFVHTRQYASCESKSLVCLYHKCVSKTYNWMNGNKNKKEYGSEMTLAILI